MALVPIMVSFTKAEALYIDNNLEAFSRVGFTLEAMSDTDFVIRSIPLWAKLDNINNIIKVVSAGALKQFDNEKYNSYLPFVLGFINSEYNHNFNNFYTDFIINICEGEGDEELNEIVSGIIDNGSLLIQDYKTTIKYNLDNIKNNIWKVNTYNKAYVIFSNLPIDLKDFSELNDCNIIINIYKEIDRIFNTQLLEELSR